MVLINNDIFDMKIGDSAIDFDLPGADGRNHRLSDFAADVLVVFFTCNHCPYANAAEQRVIRLAEEFRGKVDFVGINSNDDRNYPDDSFENMVKRAKKKKYNFAYLRDESQDIARVYGGQCTPHFFVFDKDRELRYQGRLDDHWEDEGKVTEHNLRDAIVALLKGKEVESPLAPSIGCSIKWKE